MRVFSQSSRRVLVQFQDGGRTGMFCFPFPNHRVRGLACPRSDVGRTWGPEWEGQVLLAQSQYVSVESTGTRTNNLRCSASDREGPFDGLVSEREFRPSRWWSLTSRNEGQAGGQEGSQKDPQRWDFRLSLVKLSKAVNHLEVTEIRPDLNGESNKGSESEVSET